jgi:hypothetical protein
MKLGSILYHIVEGQCCERGLVSIGTSNTVLISTSLEIIELSHQDARSQMSQIEVKCTVLDPEKHSRDLASCSKFG